MFTTKEILNANGFETTSSRKNDTQLAKLLVKMANVKPDVLPTWEAAPMADEIIANNTVKKWTSKRGTPCVEVEWNGKTYREAYGTVKKHIMRELMDEANNQ